MNKKRNTIASILGIIIVITAAVIITDAVRITVEDPIAVAPKTPAPTATLYQYPTELAARETAHPEKTSTPARYAVGYQTFAIVVSDDFDHRRESPDTDPTQNTDVILLFVVDRNQEIIHIISLPRDLYISIPITDSSGEIIGSVPNRINTAYALGGLNGLQEALYRATGIDFENIVYIDPDVFVQIAKQATGGSINFTIEELPLWDIESIVLLQCFEKYPDHPITAHQTAADTYAVQADLDIALCYARSRYPNTVYRMQRVQRVGLGLVETYLQSLSEMPPLEKLDHSVDLFHAYRNNVVINFGMTQFVNLAGLYFTHEWELNFITIQPPIVRLGTTELDWSVFYPATESIIHEFLFNEITQ